MCVSGAGRVLGQGGNNVNREGWSNSGHILKVKLARFVARTDVRYEMRTTVKNDYFLK